MTYTSASPFTHGGIDIYPDAAVDGASHDWLVIQGGGPYTIDLSPTQVAALSAYFAAVTGP